MSRPEVDSRIGLESALADRYRLGPELGRGASAVVYAGEDLRHGRNVAIKVLPTDLTSSITGERFQREIAIVARLQHPHILPFLDSGEANGSLYFVMPLIEGETLRARLRREGRLSLSETVRILSDVADALAYAHGHGVVHRDIKPDNVFLTGRNAIVADFGVAKALGAAATDSATLTRGVALGTPAYMAPEQAMADPNVDHRADLYAVGVMGYEMLAGKPPFAATNPQDTLTAQVMLTPEPIATHRPEIPADLVRIINTCLEKQPSARFQSAAALLAALDPLATPSGGMTPHPMTAVRRSWRGARLGVLAVGVVAIALAAWNLASRFARPEPLRSPTQQQLTFVGTLNEAAISPDGQFLAYTATVESFQGLFVQDLRGGTARELTRAVTLQHLDWSPDGGEVRFVASDSTGEAIKSIPRFGGSERRWLGASGILSPDGRETLGFTAAAFQVIRMTIGGADSTVIPRPPRFAWVSGAAWAPSGDRFATTFARGDGAAGVLVLASRSGPEGKIVVDSAAPSDPRWTADGKTLYWTGWHGSTADIYATEVAPIRDNQNRSRIVAANLEVDETSYTGRLSITADGRRIAYLRGARSDNIGLWELGHNAMPTMPTLATMGTASNNRPSLSPDGKWVAFSRRRGQTQTIALMPRDQSQFEEVAEGSSLNLGTSFSLDSKRMAFAHHTNGQEDVIQVFSLDDHGSKEYVVGGLGGSGVAWVSRNRLLYRRSSGQHLGLLDLTTGVARPIAEIDSASGSILSLRASADGRQFAFSWHRPANRGGDGIWISAVDAPAPRRLIEGRYLILGWAQDGKMVFITGPSATGQTIYQLAVDGGPPKAVAALPAGYTAGDISADGLTVVVVKEERHADVWAFDDPSPPRP